MKRDTKEKVKNVFWKAPKLLILTQICNTEFIIKKISLKHNHDVGASVFVLYADNRQAKNMLDAGVKPTLVTNFIRQSNFPVAKKDVYNLKQKTRFTGIPEEELMATLGLPGVTSEILVDENGTITCFFLHRCSKTVYPNAYVHPCRFHTLKAFIEEMKKQGVNNNQHLYKLLKHLVYCPVKEKFDTDVLEIEKNYPEFYTYLATNWLDRPDMFAAYARAGKMNKGVHTTNHLERFVKSLLNCLICYN
ncbi:hypothetical protein HELRODRAFT_169151 [Helobdella robusta]|uniref:MULE transposase domain-containing protein n=1 Tax=Helobdella robusta TaxID=6412 RepID=T1F1H3_HELRO|nr:hypothetical protein HELRODRAFT_169151 [Helobdella robusta]ESO08340.1 hypothetical protein HELRODRAFT_169151 [Helobdella robusta]